MLFNRYILVLRLLLILPMLACLGACSNEIKLEGSDTKIASRSVTAGGKEIIYPDDAPSIPDGKVVWQAQNCALCHAAGGEGVNGSSSINLADKSYMRKQKPVDQYEFLWFDKNGMDHPTLRGKISRNQAWDLVFYMRSLADPPLNDKELGDIDIVFKSNCAVCH